MNKHLLALAAALSLGGLAPVHAATFTGVVGSTPATVADYSTNGLISFDIDFPSLSSATLAYTIDAGDAGGLAFNAVLRNLTGAGLEGYTFGLSSGLFGNLGTVTRQFGGASVIDFNGGNASVSFSPLEFLDVEIGDPLLAGAGRLDWTILGLNAGDTLNISVSAVPEPETLALLLSGLGMVGWITRRRRKD